MKFTPKEIKLSVTNGSLTKAEATEFLISLIENSEEAKIRAKCIDLIIKLGIKTNKVFKILEYSLISDESAEVRMMAIRGIVSNFNDKVSKDLFEWVILNERNINILELVINYSEKVNKSLSTIFKKKILLRYSRIFNVLPEEANFFWDLSLIVSNKRKNTSIDHNLLGLVNASKLFPGIPTDFPLNINEPYYITKKGRVYCLNLEGYDLGEIPDSINSLSKLKYLTLRYNKLKSMPNSKYRVLVRGPP